MASAVAWAPGQRLPLLSFVGPGDDDASKLFCSCLVFSQDLKVC